MTGVTVAVATRLEERAALAALGGEAPVHRVGMGAQRLAALDSVVSCGVAGGLDPALDTGAVVVPDWVETAGGRRFECDPELTSRLRAAADRLGLEATGGGLLTADRLVVGSERSDWHRRGLRAADLETASLFSVGKRVAAVRAVLDSPRREISPRWQSPLTALCRPGLWPELAWLARHAPAAARTAAAVVAEALAASEEAGVSPARGPGPRGSGIRGYPS